MASTSAERSRATRVRRAMQRGEAPLEDLAWLRDYEKRYPRSRSFARNKGLPTTDAPQPQVTRQPPSIPPKPVEPVTDHSATSPPPNQPAQPPNVTGPAPAEAQRATVEQGWATISFDAPPSVGGAPGQAVATEAHNPCTIPDCPRCKRQAGGIMCVSTGKPVYPPMSIDAARGAAGLLFAALAMAVRFMRKDKATVSPTDAEVELLAKGLREVQMRRANIIGAVDDILMVFAALGSYTKRAFNETPPKEQS